MPDTDPKDIDVRVENQTLTLAGERKFEKQDTGKGYHRIERSSGNFVRSFAVPNSFDTEDIGANYEDIGANYKDGLLTVTLPKRPAAKPKQIKVQTAA